jgi:calcineurin-like phosphoesterase family protein
MIFFTADQHFSHANIIKYCHRPFNDVNHMNTIMIERWNSKVKNAIDVVYVIGDFIYTHSKIERRNIISKLNGQIVLIRGDHDGPWYTGLYQISDDTSLMILDHSIPITLCHWCMRVWPKSHYNSWHLYGHSHGMLPSEGKSHDVGVDNNNFYPLSLDEITEIMKFKPDNFNLVKSKDKDRKWYEQMELELTYGTGNK